MKKTLVTLDFDGVVSPIDDSVDFANNSDFSTYRLGAFQCSIRNETFDFINWLAEQPHLETVWASSWNDMTQHFSEDTDGRFPHLRYLKDEPSKGDAILAEAVRLDADEVHIFEDSPKVKARIKVLMNRNPDDYGFEVVVHKCRLKEGLTGRMIASAKSQLSLEWQRTETNLC